MHRGQRKELEMWFQAPSEPGQYAVTWQMVREGFAWFGSPQRVWIEVVSKEKGQG